MSTKLHIHQLLENIKSGVPKELDIVIDGGAFNGFYTLGALMYLKEMEKKKMCNVVRISGCSVGSILGTLYLTDSLDLLVDRFKQIRKCIKENRNIKVVQEQMIDLMNEALKDKKIELLNQRLFINYYNIDEKKNIVIDTFTDVEYLVDTILKSSYLPLLIDGNITYKDGFIDGINPYIFKNRIRKIIFLKGVTFNIGKTLNIYNERNAYSRITEGIIYMHYFFLEKKTTIASYIHKWSNIELFLFRMREILAIIIVYFMYYSQYIYIPGILNDLHIVNKLKHIMGYLVDDFLGIFLKME